MQNILPEYPPSKIICLNLTKNQDISDKKPFISPFHTSFSNDYLATIFKLFLLLSIFKNIYFRLLWRVWALDNLASIIIVWLYKHLYKKGYKELLWKEINFYKYCFCCCLTNTVQFHLLCFKNEYKTLQIWRYKITWKDTRINSHTSCQ